MRYAKREFMDELKKALDGNVSTQTYYDTMNYYEDYFKKQKEAGKSEEEICSSLICKTDRQDDH